jgi:hypothetical protein
LAVNWQPHCLLPHIWAAGSVVPCFDLPVSQRTVSNPSLVLSKERFLFPEPSFTYPGYPVKEHPLQVPLTELPLREILHFQSPPSTLSQSSR